MIGYLVFFMRFGVKHVPVFHLKKTFARKRKPLHADDADLSLKNADNSF
jgi:hypothetical protein